MDTGKTICPWSINMGHKKTFFFFNSDIKLQSTKESKKLGYLWQFSRSLCKLSQEIFVVCPLHYSIRFLYIFFLHSFQHRLYVIFRVLHEFNSDLFLETQVKYFNPFPHNDTFWRPWETSLLKTLWEKEKLLVMSNFSFSYSVFYLFG